ncbi:hypothetical protein [Parabacteroides sp. PF5-6]|uniref:hypothetical protein n=1 Tax=Parabacteroides sp. PF5-6 TaxID=1742403 RepID=UPI002404B7A5|nr:hypothetical protein [Parabacteroides sp. PF5-6]MDF9830309.1 hypothetical protein [Parabacteroides sp. PF5-6]
MKRLIVVIMVLTLCASLSYAQEKPEICAKPMVVSLERLSKYLELDAYQASQVSLINEAFIDNQLESSRFRGTLATRKKENAVYGNLKLMRDVLSTDQYRKYVTLLNVTNNSYLRAEK